MEIDLSSNNPNQVVNMLLEDRDLSSPEGLVVELPVLVPGWVIKKNDVWDDDDFPEKTKEVREIIWTLLGNPKKAVYEWMDSDGWTELRDWWENYKDLFKVISVPKGLEKRLSVLYDRPGTDVTDLAIDVHGLYRLKNVTVLELFTDVGGGGNTHIYVGIK